MLSHPSAFQTITNFRKYGIFPYILDINPKCQELYGNKELLQKCFERGYLLSEKLHQLITRENSFMFANNIFTGLKENHLAETRFYLYLGCLMSPFSEFKVVVREKPLKLENLVLLIIKDEFKV